MFNIYNIGLGWNPSEIIGESLQSITAAATTISSVFEGFVDIEFTPQDIDFSSKNFTLTGTKGAEFATEEPETEEDVEESFDSMEFYAELQTTQETDPQEEVEESFDSMEFYSDLQTSEPDEQTTTVDAVATVIETLVPFSITPQDVDFSGLTTSETSETEEEEILEDEGAKNSAITKKESETPQGLAASKSWLETSVQKIHDTGSTIAIASYCFVRNQMNTVIESVRAASVNFVADILNTWWETQVKTDLEAYLDRTKKEGLIITVGGLFTIDLTETELVEETPPVEMMQDSEPSWTQSLWQYVEEELDGIFPYFSYEEDDLPVETTQPESESQTAQPITLVKPIYLEQLPKEKALLIALQAAVMNVVNAITQALREGAKQFIVDILSTWWKHKAKPDVEAYLDNFLDNGMTFNIGGILPIQVVSA